MLLRLEVPRSELGRQRRQRLCFPIRQSKTILVSSVFQLSEQNYLMYFWVSVARAIPSYSLLCFNLTCLYREFCYGGKLRLTDSVQVLFFSIVTSHYNHCAIFYLKRWACISLQLYFLTCIASFFKYSRIGWPLPLFPLVMDPWVPSILVWLIFYYSDSSVNTAFPESSPDLPGLSPLLSMCL